ncbi:MAG: efflux RND transporter permease subunit [Elusimicrobiales bacterium]|nr:efflux RND transporter permease subunit [Elusimicrobiales bacterium]
MRFTEFFVKRPIFTTMIAFGILTLGIFSYFRIGIDLFPNVEFPFVTVKTVLKGAGPQEIESSVTKVIEEAVNTISGIEDLTSTSYEGVSIVMIKFSLEKDADIAAQEVRDKVNSILSQLPQGTELPVVSKVDFGAMPIMSVAFYSERDIIELTEIIRKRVKEVIETVNGVGSVEIVGGRKREIHIVLDPIRMQSYGISVKQITDSLKQQNVEIPGGNVEQKTFDYVLRVMGRISSVKEFKDIVVANYNGAFVRIKDLAEVIDTGEDVQSISYLNGKRAVTLSIKKQSGTNTVKVIDNVKEKLKEISKSLPSDIMYEIVGDQSIFIKGSLNAVKEHLILGAILASLVILFFIGDVRSTLISAIAIPVSVIGSFSLMDLSGFTLNNMTLLALVIGVGLVIDDAIVMIENIHRNIERSNLDEKNAAIIGSTEIAFAVIAISISLLAIFIPLAYMQGMVGRFMKSFGLTLAYSVAISTIVALTVTPSYSALFLKRLKSNSLTNFSEKINNFITSYYIKILKYSIEHIKLMVLISVLVMILFVFLLKNIGKDFLPIDDTSMFQVNITAKEGTNILSMEKLLFKIEKEIKDKIPYVNKTLVAIGTSQSGISSKNEGYVFFELVPQEKRKENLQSIMSKVRKILSKYKDLRTSVIVGGMGSVSGMKNYEFEYVISGPDLEILARYANKIVDRLRNIKGAVDIDTSFSYAKPEYKVIINRDMAHKLGVKIEDLATALRSFVSGAESVTKFRDGDELYEVKVRVDERWRNNPDVLKSLSITSSSGKLVRIDNIASIEKGYGPTQIDRYNRQRKISIYANIEGGASLSQLIKTANEEFNNINTSPLYSANPVGKAKEFGRMLKSFFMAFVFAFIFVYIVLAAQFESFVYPISIIIILPLTLPFALISLYITGTKLTIFGLMGMFMLFGIVKKNSILQVDYTNTLRAKGVKRYDAVIEANKIRLRPILMTTITLVFAMIPTALGTGPGSAMRRSLAGVIIGGQVLSLLITLIMTPVTYIIMDEIQNRIIKRFKKE